jgi:hypothetical protein
MEVEAAIAVGCRTVAVDYRSSDYVRVLRRNASYSDGFAQEVDVPVALACVSARGDDHFVGIFAVINSSLDGGILAGDQTSGGQSRRGYGQQHSGA